MTDGSPSRALILSVLVVALPLCSAQPTASVDFAAPAQAQGASTVQDAQWILLLFHQAKDTSFVLSLPNGANQSNATYLQWERPGPYPDQERLPTPLPTKSVALGPSESLARFGEPWASLLLVADSISLAVANGTMSLDYALAGNLVTRQLPAMYYPEDVTHNNPPPAFQLQKNQPSLGLQAMPAAANLPMHLQANGIHHIAWHNVDIGCHWGDCPESGKPWEASFDAMGTTSVERLTYIDLNSNSGTLEGSGEARAIAVGGTSLNLVLDGRLRLPATNLQGTCGNQACPDPAGKTFQAAGNLTISNLSLGPKASRLRAGLSGSFYAAFDESPAPAFTVQQGVGVGLAVVGVAVIVKVLLGLFSRQLSPEDALAHPRRRELFEAVCQHPGSTYRVLMDATGLSDGVTRHHLKSLSRAGLIIARGHGQAIHYFENHGRYDKTWKPVAALRDPYLQELHEWVAAHPGAQQKEILEQGRLRWHCSPATVRKRLLRLEAWGLIVAELKGRQRYYRAAYLADGAASEDQQLTATNVSLQT